MTPRSLCDSVHGLCPGATRWVVAFSGGLDSHALLHMVAQHSARPPLVALHINHGVQLMAAAWQQHCRAVAENMGIPFFCVELNLGEAVSEAQMREARYSAFQDFVSEGDVLLMAHHGDDQVETVLLRLMRGAGARGLGGIPAARPLGQARLCRPLLDTAREVLIDYARCHQLSWIEDPSNQDERYDRNFMRHRVLPMLSERWPGAREAMRMSSEHAREAASMAVDIAALDARKLTDKDRFGEPRLDLARWHSLSALRADNLLRHWIESHAGVAVNARLLDAVRNTVITVRADARAEVRVGNLLVRRFRDHLHLVSADTLEALNPCALAIGQVCLLQGAGRVQLVAVDHPQRDDQAFRPGRHYELRFREPGLRCKAAGRVTRTLKDWFQSYAIPPWQRQRVPLLFVDGALAAVGDLFVCEGHAAQPGESALRLQWTPFN